MSRLLLKRTWMVVVAASVMTAAAQSPPVPLTLKKAVELALERNPEAKIARERLTEVQGQVKEVRSGAYPQVNFESFAMGLRDPSILNSASFDQVPPEFKDLLAPHAYPIYDVGISVKQPLYTAGKIRNAIRLAGEVEKSQEARLETARQGVSFQAFQAFHHVLLARENLAVLEETSRQRLKHLELARERFKEGVATEIDVLRSEVNAANLEPDLLRARNRIRLTRAALNSVLMFDLESPIDISGSLEYRPWLLPPLEELQNRGLQDRSEIRAARHELEQTRLLVRIAEAENKLNVDFEGRAGFNVREPVNLLFNPSYARWSANVSLRLPVYDGGRKAGRVIQAQSRFRMAEQSMAQLENSIRLEVKAAHDVLETTARAIQAADLNVRQADRVLTMMQANYRYGAATTLDVVDSETALTIARNARLLASYEYEIAKARLRLATGCSVVEPEDQP